jgi:hypothetical protein
MLDGIAGASPRSKVGSATEVPTKLVLASSATLSSVANNG